MKILSVFPLLAILSVHSIASAQEKVPFKIGIQADLSVPSGVALGLEARLPHLPWFKLGLSGTYTLAPGLRGNLLLDPINFPIVPVANVDVGWQSPFTVPNLKNSPSSTWTYCDLQGGLAVGSRDGFRFMLLAGMSYLDGNVSGLQGFVNTSQGVSFGDPHFNGWVPNAKMSFNWLF